VRAFFIIPFAHAPMLVDAWDSFNGGRPSWRLTLNVWNKPVDVEMLRRAKRFKPDIIFYMGANEGQGLPSFETLREFRKLAPTVHLIWDAVDTSWHAPIVEYRKEECFDLQVSLDGAVGSPVDMSTLTPIHVKHYGGPELARKIKCGFAGQSPQKSLQEDFQHPRYYLIDALTRGKLIIHRNDITGPYKEYAKFLRSCLIALNSSYSGSGFNHSVKARVVEVGFSGAALLEAYEAPTKNWIPEEHLLLFKDTEDAARIIREVSDEEIKAKAEGFNNYVREHYNPKKIYEGILERLRL